MFRLTVGALCAAVVLICPSAGLADETYIAFTEPDPDGNSYQPGPGREGFLGVVLSF